MRIKDIFNDQHFYKIFEIEDIDENYYNWNFKETTFDYIPDNCGFYLIPGYKISESKKVETVYISISTPERIIDHVFCKTFFGLKMKNIYEFSDLNIDIISAVPAVCFGNYELFYSKNNPEIGISILKMALNKFNVSIIAEDLGYIYRDENRYIEAIEAFEKSAILGPSSEYIYNELSNLYRMIGDLSSSEKYKNKLN